MSESLIMYLFSLVVAISLSTCFVKIHSSSRRFFLFIVLVSLIPVINWFIIWFSLMLLTEDFLKCKFTQPHLYKLSKFLGEPAFKDKL